MKSVEGTKVTIKRISNTEYSFANSTKDGIRVVARALTFKNPYPFAYSDKILKFDKKRLTFKIGMLNTLKEYLDDCKYLYEVFDYQHDFPEGIEIDDRVSGKYVHQRMAVEAFFKRRFGIIVVPTRGGKTFIASEIFRIFLVSDSGNCLFLTDNTTLFNQAKSDIEKFFEKYGGIEIGEIKSGKIDITKRITVGMIQTIQSTLSNRCKDNVKKRGLKKYLKDLKFLCVDEIHDNCSDSKLKIFKMAKNLEYQLCLSATPYRSGAYVQNLKLKEWSGDVVYEITEKTLRDRGVLSDYIVFMLLIDHNNIEYGSIDRDYNELRELMVFKSEFRNKMLKSVLNVLKELNLKTLVLFQSVQHGQKISAETGIPFISGETKDRKREYEKEKFLKDKGGFLLASNIFKKGVTLPEVEVLINVDGGLEDANTIQKKGRVLGATDSKSKSVVIDFFDLFDDYLSEHSKTRLLTYVESVGENGVEILDTSVEDWSEILKKDVEKWFGNKNSIDMP